MGSMFRSEAMALCQIFIQPEAAYASFSELGETGTVQFRDLNDGTPATQRKFVNEVRRCDEIERKIRYIDNEVRKDDVRLPPLHEEPKALDPKEIINLEAHLEKIENEIIELSQNHVNLKANLIELTELQQVLVNTQGVFTDQKMMRRGSIITEDIVKTTQGGGGQLGFVAGVMQRERIFSFETMLWRISRGNVFLRQIDLQPYPDPETGHMVYKTVFVAFFQGDQLKNRIKKVCTGFRASLYPCPSTQQERDEMLKGVRTRLEDLKMVLNQTDDHRKRVLASAADKLPNWIIMVKKMKAIYHALNLCNLDVMKEKCLIAEGWVPQNDLVRVQQALSDGSNAVGSAIPSFLNVIQSDEVPPTFNRTNRFTQGFQNLIDSYGMATYGEVNPALYTIITFPFLFALMYGDMGHGLILAIFGAWMVLNENKFLAQKSTNEIWNIFFGGRYIILLMGIFSMYTGLVYNDLFSKSMNIFGSAWRNNYNESTIEKNLFLQLNPTEDMTDNIYVIGLDPIWQLGQNKIVFLNTFKMKLSIIIGVVHMMFGVSMSVVNHIYFRRSINIVLEFLPQIIFLLLMFGYMVTLMFIKWIMYSAKSTQTRFTPGCAPSVLITFINMVLFKNSPPQDPNCVTEFMFPGQDYLQKAFVAIALLCIPWMLLAKPFYIKFTRKPKLVHENGDEQDGSLSNPIRKTKKASAHDEEEPISEVFIHQAIHTIEYVLGTVSHTASYLRLWALSLAHAQLSDVVWGRVFAIGLKADGYAGAIMIYILFAVWVFLTVSILVLIEGLSAFLHTLRLHWVEFMSKFYEGVGYAFEPFAFKAILDAEDENEK